MPLAPFAAWNRHCTTPMLQLMRHPSSADASVCVRVSLFQALVSVPYPDCTARSYVCPHEVSWDQIFGTNSPFHLAPASLPNTYCVPNTVKASLDEVLSSLAHRFKDTSGVHLLERLVQCAAVTPGGPMLPGMPRGARKRMQTDGMVSVFLCCTYLIGLTAAQACPELLMPVRHLRVGQLLQSVACVGLFDHDLVALDPGVEGVVINGMPKPVYSLLHAPSHFSPYCLPVRLDLVTQLNEIEARNEEYPETIAFMRLLNSLIAASLLRGGALSSGKALCNAHSTLLAQMYGVIDGRFFSSQTRVTALPARLNPCSSFQTPVGNEQKNTVLDTLPGWAARW
eukprot:1146003-Pelagomonas_calceolata.AAC.7